MKVIDIAAAAGVSPSTVSRVLSGKGRISPKTAAHIRDIIRKMSTRTPDIRLSSRIQAVLNQSILAFTFGDYSRLDFTCSSSFLKNLSFAMSNHGFNLVCIHLPSQDSPLPGSIETAAGAILLKGTPSGEFLKRLLHIPVISLGPVTHFGDQLVLGYCRIGQMAAEFLLDQSVQEYAVLNALPDFPGINEQVYGFKLCISESGRHVTEIVSPTSAPEILPDREMDMLEQRLTPLVDRLLQLPAGRIGVFVPDDWVTALTYRILLQNNKFPEGRFCFISSGNSPEAFTGLHPRPATIEIGQQAMAEQVVNLLMLRIQSSELQQSLQIALEPKLIPGEKKI